LKEKYNKLRWKEAPVLKFFEGVYLPYTKGQERWTPQLQKLLTVIRTKYKGNAPEWFRDFYRGKSFPLLKYTNMLSFNLRAIVLCISVLSNYPWVYFMFELTVMNGLFYYMVTRYEHISRKFTHGLEKSRQQ
jgi:hypothetical protein